MSISNFQRIYCFHSGKKTNPKLTVKTVITIKIFIQYNIFELIFDDKRESN